jgi:hypothetical protein
MKIIVAFGFDTETGELFCPDDGFILTVKGLREDGELSCHDTGLMSGTSPDWSEWEVATVHGSHAPVRIDGMPAEVVATPAKLAGHGPPQAVARLIEAEQAEKN